MDVIAAGAASMYLEIRERIAAGTPPPRPTGVVQPAVQQPAGGQMKRAPLSPGARNPDSGGAHELTMICRMVGPVTFAAALLPGVLLAQEGGAAQAPVSPRAAARVDLTGTWVSRVEYLALTWFLEDPQYLTAPFIRTVQFTKERDGSQWAPTPCSAR
jgi:hypothetical protein